MKKLVMICMLVSVTAHAQEKTVELSKRNVVLNVDISETKVKLSRAGYGSPTLKILVPDLADVTILDHRNIGEGAPCLATYDANSPERIIQKRPAIEQVKFTVTLQKKATIIPGETPTCEITLNESVEGMVRGFQFMHFRSILVGNRNVDDCR